MAKEKFETETDEFGYVSFRFSLFPFYVI